MKDIILGFGLLCLSLNIYSQVTTTTDMKSLRDAREGIIKGKVVEEKGGNAMEFTSVALYRMRDSSLVDGVITATDGSFILKDLPYGRFYIVANFVGFEEGVKNDILLTPKAKILDIGEITLQQAAEELGEVEIIADQSNVKYMIDRKVVNVGQDINAETGTAADVLENVPSVNVDIEGNVTLRGSGNFTVLIDGKPSALTGSDALQQIPASAIRNIEIITNPSAKYDPDGMAGIINIISKKSALEGLSGIVNVTAGTWDKYKGDFLINYRTDKFNVYGGASYQDMNHSGSFLSSKTITDDDTGLESYDILEGSRDMSRSSNEIKIGIDYNINDNNVISLSGEAGEHKFGHGGIQNQHIYDELLTENNYSVNDNFSTHGGKYSRVNLNFKHDFAESGHELVAFINYSYHDGSDADSQSEYATDENYKILASEIPDKIRTSELGDEHEIRAQIDYTKPIGKEGKLEAGYQFRLDNEIESYDFENYDPDLGIWINNDLYSSSIDFYRNIQALYTTYGNKYGKFQYQLGLRGEYTDREVKHAASDDPAIVNRFDLFPTVHLSRSFNNNHQLMMSYSRRINRPRGWYLEEFLTYMNSTTLRKGNSALLPEYMNSYELSYQKSFGKSFFAFETYYKNTVNKIERVEEIYDPEERIFLMTFENISKDHSLGMEAMVNFAQLSWMNVNATASLYRYWIEGQINGIEIDTRSNNWNMRLNTNFNLSPKTRVQITVMYNGPSVTAQGKRGAFFFTNAAIKQDFFDRKLSATLQIRDILGSMKHSFTSNGQNFVNNVEFTREPRIVMLSLSYKINNYKQRRDTSSNEGNDMSEGDMY